VYEPVTQPKLKYMNAMFGAQMLMMKPNDAINVPAIATIRHPNLLVSALAIGPADRGLKLYLLIAIRRPMGSYTKYIMLHRPLAIIFHYNYQFF